MYIYAYSQQTYYKNESNPKIQNTAVQKLSLNIYQITGKNKK